jgi:hypothetical protein
VYRWTDAKGVVQYSDKWVPGSVVVKTDKNHGSAPTPAAPDPAASGASRGNDIVSEQQGKRTVEGDVAKSKAEQCKRAQSDYEKAIQSRRLYKEAPNGAREYISDAEADAYRLQLLNNRKQLCGS